MQDFIELIKLAKSENENAMLEIIESFSPLICKYTRMMNYDEDFKSEMTLKLITIVKTELDFSKFREINNYMIIKYIETALYHHYIKLSKQRNAKMAKEITYEYNDLTNLFDNNPSLNYLLSDEIYLDIVRGLLTEREFLCVKYIIIMGYTADQVAKLLGVTKQAINQCKQRALKKIRKGMFENFSE